jgi:riboflavin synthase
VFFEISPIKNKKPEICLMFTGIIEEIGIVKEVIKSGTNISYWIESSLSHLLKIDQSLSHDGVCLTVEEINGTKHKMTAIDETLQKTNLVDWKAGSLINLERCLQMNGRLDGHFVQGHIDCTGICLNKTEKDGSWEFELAFPEKYAELVIEKGSITLNGISLTVFDVTTNSFKVAVIPYTYMQTNIKNLNIDHKVNIEFDLIGKYILRRISLNANS